MLEFNNENKKKKSKNIYNNYSSFPIGDATMVKKDFHCSNKQTSTFGYSSKLDPISSVSPPKFKLGNDKKLKMLAQEILQKNTDTRSQPRLQKSMTMARAKRKMTIQQGEYDGPGFTLSNNHNSGFAQNKFNSKSIGTKASRRTHEFPKWINKSRESIDF